MIRMILLLKQNAIFYYYRINKKIPGYLKEKDSFYKKFNNKINKKFNDSITYVCDGSIRIGGFADRIKGILTTYYECKKYQKRFYIFWDTPFKLEEYLKPNDYNWLYPYKELNYNKFVFPAIIWQCKNFFWISFRKILFRYWFVSKPKEMYVYTNLNWHKQYHSKLFFELFVPSKILLEHILIQKKILNENYWSFSFRFNQLLGDFKDCIGFVLSEDSKNELINKNITELKKLLKEMPKGYKALITSDSEYFLRKVSNVDINIHICFFESAHMEYQREISNKEIWLYTLVDFYLIKDAERVYLMKTGDMYKSGFAELASSIGKKKYIVHNF